MTSIDSTTDLTPDEIHFREAAGVLVGGMSGGVTVVGHHGFSAAHARTELAEALEKIDIACSKLRG